MIFKQLGCLYLFACSLTCVAQTYKPATFTDLERQEKIAAVFPLIDKIYKEFAEKNHWPGTAYGLVVDGKLVHKSGIGYTDIANKIAVTPKSVFRIASMTKSFTAMAILKLRDEGKLKLDDPAYLYIPEMKAIKYPGKDATPITIRHLLTHGAGFPEDNPWGDRQLAVSDSELMSIYKNGVSMSTIPGKGYEYSNLGFATLGYIIKNVSGKTYQAYITENILKPLGMRHTYWEYSDVPKNLLALGYRWIDNNWTEQPMLHDGAYGAMGGLLTSIEDFNLYLSLHLNAWPERDDEDLGPIKRNAIREMSNPWNMGDMNLNAKLTTGKPCPVISAYGYGIRWVRNCDNIVYAGHTGGLPGFGSQWNILPEYGIGIISFANLTYANSGYVNKQVLDTIIALTGIKPRLLPASAILETRKNELVKTILNWDNAANSGIFAGNFFMDYFPDRLKRETAEAFAQAGKRVSIGELVAENQLRVYFIMKHEKARIKISFTLTPENPPLIQEYRMEVLK
ncbi:MAG: serine hydrolase domain-containing protein [Bacteroidota bacterium]